MPKIRRLAGYVHRKGRRQRTVRPSRRIGFERIKIVAPQTLEIGPAGDGRDGDHPLFAVRASGYVHQKLLRYQTAHQPSVGTKVPSVPVRRWGCAMANALIKSSFFAIGVSFDG